MSSSHDGDDSSSSSSNQSGAAAAEEREPIPALAPLIFTYFVLAQHFAEQKYGPCSAMLDEKRLADIIVKCFSRLKTRIPYFGTESLVVGGSIIWLFFNRYIGASRAEDTNVDTAAYTLRDDMSGKLSHPENVYDYLIRVFTAPTRFGMSLDKTGVYAYPRVLREDQFDRVYTLLLTRHLLSIFLLKASVLNDCTEPVSLTARDLNLLIPGTGVDNLIHSLDNICVLSTKYLEKQEMQQSRVMNEREAKQEVPYSMSVESMRKLLEADISKVKPTELLDDMLEFFDTSKEYKEKGRDDFLDNLKRVLLSKQ